jgi:alkylhydroperoxidase family enzyme
VPAFAYEFSPYPIRPDIVSTYQRIWDYLASPGNWYTAAERLAIAQEVRGAHRCALCRRRKQSLAPYSEPGSHDHAGRLAEPVVEAVHRLTTDSARLKKSWYDGLLEEGLSDAEYVEVVAIVTLLVAVDEFHHALGLPLEPLPDPIPGEPSRYRPPGATAPGAWVPMVGAEGATGAEADLYADAARSAHVLMALSLVPDAVRVSHLVLDSLYMGADVPDGSTNRGRALARPQIELLAARVSAINDCFY